MLTAREFKNGRLLLELGDLVVGGGGAGGAVRRQCCWGWLWAEVVAVLLGQGEVVVLLVAVACPARPCAVNPRPACAVVRFACVGAPFRDVCSG